MEFLVLGPLSVRDEGRELDLGSGRQRALLALLVLHAGETLSLDRICDALWGERPPASAAKVVQGYVSQLRRALPPDTIRTRGSGYALGVAASDAAEFERLVDAARDQDATGAAATLRAALALWRGPPYADVEYEPWAQAEIARLEELRLVALEERLDAELRLGEAARLVPELEALAREHPLRERLRALQMLALYRSGRQAEALDAFRDARRRLVDELGLEPGPELQELQRQILEQDAALGAPARPRALARVARRARWLAVAGALVLAGAVATGAVLATRGGTGVAANSLVLLDGASGRVDAQIRVGSRPSQIAVGAGAVWVLNSDDNTVSQIDPGSDSTVATFAAGPRPVQIAATGGGVWVGNAGVANSQVTGTNLPTSLTRFDPSTRGASATVALPKARPVLSYGRLPGTRLIVEGAGSLWTIGPDIRLVRLDAATGAVQHRYPIPADSLAFGDGELWIVQQGSQVLRLDPATNKVDFSYPLAAGPGVAYGFGSAWVADPVQQVVWRVTASTPPRLRSIPVPGVATAVTVSDGAVWASSVPDDEVVRIDPARNRVTTVVPLTAPQDLAPAAHGVWVSTGSRPSASGPLPASSCGPVAYEGPGRPRFIVASDLALQGSGSRSTVPMRQAIEQVIRDRGFRAGRYTIGYQSCDDSTIQAGSADWAKCIANARSYASDREVIGVVGTYNSGCAWSEIPILDGARGGPVAMVSPMNTDAQLTIPALVTVPGYRLYPAGVRNFARVIGADQIEDAADALLERRLGATRIAVLDDGSVQAQHADSLFTYAATRLGLRTVRVPWSLAHPQPAKAVAAVRAAHVDGVYVAAGGLPEGPPVVAALRRALPRRVPIVVSDWFFTLPEFAQLGGGHAVDGVYVTIAGMPNWLLPEAGKRLVARLPRSPSWTAAYGAAAAQVLLDAIARSDGTRASVARDLFRWESRSTAIGPVTLDSNGDPLEAPVSVFRMKAGARNGTGLIDDQDAVFDRVVVPPPRIVAYTRPAAP